jgi:hypothetical protein
LSATVDRIRSKIARAKQHLVDFELGLKAFHETNPYEVSYKERPETGQRVYYISRVDCVPDQLTCIAADVLQNLRSPLDQLAWQLRTTLGDPPDNNVNFPMTNVPTEHETLCRRNMKGVPQDVMDAVIATKAYPGGDGHALWQLKELNNPDKHQLLVSAASTFQAVDAMPFIMATMNRMLVDIGDEPIASLPPLPIRPADQLLPLSLGDELLLVPLDARVDQQPGFAFDVAFNAPGVVGAEPALRTLRDMTQLVDDLIVKLGRFLP